MASEKKTPRIMGLDGLRTLALVGVLLYHMFPKAVPGGFYGVILFFVISGFLAGYSGTKELRAGKFSIFRYYVKRFFRIYPALIIVLFVSIGVMTFVDVDRMANIPEEVTSILLGYNNFWQLKMNASYFTNLTNTSMFTHLWYVAILIQFELVWPFFLTVYGIARRHQSPGTGVAILAGLTAFTYFIMPAMYLFQKDPNITRIYYGTDTRIFSLLGGALLGIMYGEGVRMGFPYRKNKVIAYLFTALFLGTTVFLYLKGNGQAGVTYICGMALYTLFCVLAIDCVSERKTGVGKVLDFLPFKWISKYSYEIYLWQYPVLFLTGIVMVKAEPALFYGVQAVLILVLSLWLNRFTGQIARIILKK
ncbi:MAG: acyltransferase [Erysipelotrichales bacterium]|nr:acyltransferase [Erysipelotrichales bacterium]